jgi:hypothetical protein
MWSNRFFSKGSSILAVIVSFAMFFRARKLLFVVNVVVCVDVVFVEDFLSLPSGVVAAPLFPSFFFLRMRRKSGKNFFANKERKVENNKRLFNRILPPRSPDSLFSFALRLPHSSSSSSQRREKELYHISHPHI